MFMVQLSFRDGTECVGSNSLSKSSENKNKAPDPISRQRTGPLVRGAVSTHLMRVLTTGLNIVSPAGKSRGISEKFFDFFVDGWEGGKIA
jgi:hypothetical protein